MKFAEDWKRIAGIVCATAVLAAMQAMAQNNERTGVSHPPTAPIVDTDDAPAMAPAKPSAAVPMSQAAPTAGSVIKASPSETYGAYVPYRGAGAATAPATATAAPGYDPDANIVTSATAGRHEISPANPNDPDAGIVTRVISPAGAVAEGSLIKAKLRESLSTETTKQGTDFTAVLSAPVMREGEVIAGGPGDVCARRYSIQRRRSDPSGAAIHHAARRVGVSGARAGDRHTGLGQDEGGR